MITSPPHIVSTNVRDLFTVDFFNSIVRYLHELGGGKISGTQFDRDTLFNVARFSRSRSHSIRSGYLAKDDDAPFDAQVNKFTLGPGKLVTFDGFCSTDVEDIEFGYHTNDAVDHVIDTFQPSEDGVFFKEYALTNIVTTNVEYHFVRATLIDKTSLRWSLHVLTEM